MLPEYMHARGGSRTGNNAGRQRRRATISRCDARLQTDKNPKLQTLTQAEKADSRWKWGDSLAEERRKASRGRQSRR